MKNKLKTIILISLIPIVALVLTTPVLTNIWGILIEKGYVIPKESSIFAFEPTQMSTGNSDYWLYGEDEQYYYSTMAVNNNLPYIKIDKEQAEKQPYFNSQNYQTWDDRYLCGDLLQMYGTKPKYLTFQQCTVIGEQKVVEATYHTDTKHSYAIENFFVKHYGMRKLYNECRAGVCTWGVLVRGIPYLGYINVPELRKINANYELAIAMSGYHLINNRDQKPDRNKVKQFTVTVFILDI